MPQPTNEEYGYEDIVTPDDPGEDEKEDDDDDTEEVERDDDFNEMWSDSVFPEEDQ